MVVSRVVWNTTPKHVQEVSWDGTVLLQELTTDQANSNDIYDIYIMQPLLLLECNSDMPSCILWPPTFIKLSTNHSYQTLRSSVCRQKLTSTSESAGNCMGV